MNYNSFTQDTTKPKTKPVIKEDTAYVQNFILADHNYQYLIKNNPDTLTRRRFLWYPTKTLEDMFSYIPGYYLSYMDVGQFNPISFNQMGYTTGVFRHGRPINDNMDGTIDWNLLSRNEIAEIEVSNGFGNNLYNYSNSVNIIDRELYQFRPYTEISYYQDRYENLYFDGNYHQNLFRKLNFNFGITKHSYDGHYVNSDFDKWLGRFNLNFAPSNKLNFFLNVNYSKIQKGLNGGINADTVNLGDKDKLFNSTTAIVNNSDAYEIKERFDIDLGSVFLAGKNSFTKFQAYVSNSFRKYRDEENRPNPNGIYYKSNYHWITYGAKLQEVFGIKSIKNIDITSRTELDYNYTITDFYTNVLTSITSSNTNNGNSGELNYIQNIDLSYKNLILTGYIRGYTYNISRVLYYFYGINADYKVKVDSNNSFAFNGQFNTKDDYTSLKTGFEFGQNSIGTQFYYYNSGNGIYKGVNNIFKFRLYKFDLEGIYSYNFVPSYKIDSTFNEYIYSPVHYGNLNLSWHDVAFKNKLEYKIGLNSRFWSEYHNANYSTNPTQRLRIPANATLDFYIIGKIGKATFGLTLENILDRIIYNTGVYPFMDRGGFLNTISRFNITWNFFD